MGNHSNGKFVAISLQGRSQIEVQQVSDRSSMAGSMHINAEQQRLLDNQMDDMEIGELQPGKKSEFAKFCEYEPMKSLKFALRKVNGVSKKKDDEISQICSQVSIPEEVVERVARQFAGAPHIAQQLESFKEFLYDPSAAATEVLGCWHF